MKERVIAKNDRIYCPQFFGYLSKERTGEPVFAHGTQITAAINVSPDGRAPAKKSKPVERFIREKIVDHDQLRVIVPPLVLDRDDGVSRIDRRPREPAAIRQP